MKRVLVLGGYGLLGRRLVAKLIASTSMSVIVAGRRLEPATALCQQIDPDRCHPRQVDASDVATLTSALRESDLMINCLDSSQHLGAVAICLARAGCPAIDLTITPDRTAIWTRHAAALRAAETYAVVDAGAQPGTPALVARRLLEQSPGGDDLRVATAVRLQVPPDSKMPSSMIDLVAQLTIVPKVYRRRRWRTDWLSYLWPFKRISFHSPFGNQACAVTTLPEVQALTLVHPSLTRAEYSVGGLNAVVSYLWLPLLMPLVWIFGRLSYRPVAWLLFYAGLRPFSRPPFGMAIRAELHKHGRPIARLELQHDDEYELTVIAVLACLSQLRNQPPKPGVHLMGMVLQPTRFEHETATSGARWLHETS